MRGDLGEMGSLCAQIGHRAPAGKGGEATPAVRKAFAVPARRSPTQATPKLNRLRMRENRRPK